MLWKIQELYSKDDHILTSHDLVGKGGLVPQGAQSPPALLRTDTVWAEGRREAA